MPAILVSFQRQIVANYLNTFMVSDIFCYFIMCARTRISYFECARWACLQFIYVPAKKAFACNKKGICQQKKFLPAKKAFSCNFFLTGGNFFQEAHQNGWHVASSYRNAILLNSELTFPISNVRTGPACNLFMCLQKSVCLQ
jgi:hypothetical protein